MKTTTKCFLLMVVLFVMPAMPTLGQQDEYLDVGITGEDAIFAQGTITDPGILTSITPNVTEQGQSLTVVITGSGTRFGQATWTGGDMFLQCTPTNSGQGTPTIPEQGTPTTVADVWLSQGSSTIDWIRGWPLYDGLFYALFDIPEDANFGKWDVHVEFAQCTPTTIWDLTLLDGFTIAQPGDSNLPPDDDGDGCHDKNKHKHKHGKQCPHNCSGWTPSQRR
ncbi:MAG: hypothetical protein PHY02_08825 [Phycisphaerae bacterium]|nr:hypothetical protein [Phycisphaerae bacterium]